MLSVETLKSRFLDELETIDHYVQYMEQNFYLQYEKLEIVSELVDRFDFYTEDMEQRRINQDIIKRVQFKIQEALFEYKQKINSLHKIEIPEWANDLKILKDEYGLVEYLNPVYHDDDQKYKEYLYSLDPDSLKVEVDGLVKDNSYSAFEPKDYQRLIEYMKIKNNNDILESFEATYDELLNFLTLYKIFDSDNPINIYRQSFILLMTAFDATMYDISKEIFVDKFFDCVDKIDDKGKISYSEIARKGSFEEMASDIVEASLGKIYLQKLLFIIRDCIEGFFTFNGRDLFIDIIEMVKRRNVHVHNKGIVDHKYFESDVNHNMYSLAIDDYAAIDDNYYISAYENLKLLMTCSTR